MPARDAQDAQDSFLTSHWLIEGDCTIASRTFHSMRNSLGNEPGDAACSSHIEASGGSALPVEILSACSFLQLFVTSRIA